MGYSFSDGKTDKAENKDKIVTKAPLYPEGIENAGKLLDNICALKERGIPVAEHRWEGDHLEIEYIDAPTLSNYLKSLVQKKFLIEDGEQYKILPILHPNKDEQGYMLKLININ